MNIFPPLKICAALVTLSVATSANAAPLLVPGEPVVLTDTHGRFDFLNIDPERRRLLAAHTGNGSLDIVDLDSHKLLKAVAVGAAQGSAVDSKNARYYVSVSKPPQMAVVSATTFEVIGKVPLTGPADVMAFNSATGRAYVCHDDASESWVIDPDQQKVVATVSLPSDSPEDLAFDPTFEHLFQAMKNGNLVAVIEPATNKVTASYPTAPAVKPHGISLLADSDGLLVVGGNGKLILMSRKDGKILSSADVATGVDQIAYDPGLKRVYCASGLGSLSIVSLDGGKLVSMGSIPTAPHCHSVAVDAKTHTVWVALLKGEQPILQPFTAPAE